jgi:hypothetical protein
MFLEYEKKDTDGDKWQDFKDDIGHHIYSELGEDAKSVDFDKIVDYAIDRHYNSSGEIISKHDDYFPTFEASVQKVLEEIANEEDVVLADVEIEEEKKDFLSSVKDSFLFIEKNAGGIIFADEDSYPPIREEYCAFAKENLFPFTKEEAKIYFDSMTSAYILMADPEINLNNDDVKELSLAFLLNKDDVEHYIEKGIEYDISSAKEDIESGSGFFVALNKQIINSLEQEKEGLRALNERLTREIKSPSPEPEKTEVKEGIKGKKRTKSLSP